jgi:hypothetical protein
MSVLSPTGIKAACGMGLLGGVLSVAFMSLSYGPEEETLPLVAFYMLIAVLFFAIAGAFTKNSQWKFGVTEFMIFITIGTIGACMAADYVAVPYGAVLIVVAVCLMILTALPSTKSWLDKTI